MKTSLLTIVTTLSLLLIVLCCSESQTRDGSNSNSSAFEWDTNNEGVQLSDLGNQESSDSNNSFENSTDGLGEGDVCHDVTSSVSSVPTRVMLLEDKSLSMSEEDKWGLAQNAIESMVAEFDQEIEFGIDLFSIGTDPTALSCEVGDSVELDVAMGNSAAIMSALNAQSPSGATPLMLAMKNFTSEEYAPVFLDNKAQSYLVIISDGKDTCGHAKSIDIKGVSITIPIGATTNELVAVTSELLNDYNIKTIVIGFGDAINPQQLNAIAAEGGTAFTNYLDASNGEELASALDSIAEKVVVSCRYRLGDINRAALNLDLVNIYFDGVAVPRDDGCQSGIGWTWLDESRETIQFCEQACSTLESGNASEITIKIMCSEDVVVVV